jgi:hypothetical protein
MSCRGMWKVLSMHEALDPAEDHVHDQGGGTVSIVECAMAASTHNAAAATAVSGAVMPWPSK